MIKMPVLGFFVGVERGLVTGATTNREYVHLLAMYEKAGCVTSVGISYKLTDSGKEHLAELRKLAVVLVDGLVEGHPEEIGM